MDFWDDLDEFEKRRYAKFVHCRKRLFSRYGIRLDTYMWLKFNNRYWKNKCDHIIIDHRGKLCIFQADNITFFGLFSPEYLVYSTFLDPKYGEYGTVRWENGKLINI